MDKTDGGSVTEPDAAPAQQGGDKMDGGPATEPGKMDAAPAGVDMAPGMKTDAGSATRVDPMASSTASAQRAADIVKQLGTAVKFDSSQGNALSKFLGMLVGGASSSAGTPKLAVPSPLPRPIGELFVHTPARKSLAGQIDISLTTQQENFDDTAKDLQSLLADRVLAPSNVESMTDTSVTYLLKPDPTCRPLPSSIAAGREDRVSEQCASDLTKLQIRIVVSHDGDGYRFQVLVGPDKLELSAFIIHSDLLGWEMDLDMAVKASNFVEQALGRPVSPLPFSTMKGRIKVAVQKLGDKKVSFSFSVLAPVEIRGKSDAPYSFAIAAADPMLAVTGDGNTSQVTVKVAIPRVDVTGPWDPKKTGAKNMDLHVALGGLTGETTIADGMNDVSLGGLGVGPSFVEVRGTHIADLAFNPANGNKMDLKVHDLGGGRVRLEMVPRFDLTVGMALDSIASELSSAPPSYLLHETYRAVLSEGNPVIVETVDASGEFRGGLRVVAGNLVLSTSSDANATVTVSSGQCLTTTKMPPQGAHPLLGSLTATTCP